MHETLWLKGFLKISVKSAFKKNKQGTFSEILKLKRLEVSDILKLPLTMIDEMPALPGDEEEMF